MHFDFALQIHARKNKIGEKIYDLLVQNIWQSLY